MCVCVRVCVHVSVYTRTHARVYTYIHTYIHTYMRTCKHLCMPVYEHTQTHTHTHTHTLTHTLTHTQVDTMFHELVQTYVEREAQANEELRRARESSLSTLKKNRRLYQAYRSLRFFSFFFFPLFKHLQDLKAGKPKLAKLTKLMKFTRYQLEDLAPAGVAIQLLDEESLQVEGDVGDVEKQQRQTIEELRDKLSKAETTAVAKSERALKEAEKFSQKASHMQAELTQYKSMVSKLEQEKASAEEDARSKQGELQRLERQLLQELHDLKVRGIQTVPAAAPAAAAATVDEGQVRELRRELDRSSVECDRLRNEVDRLRRAPPAPAPAPVPAAAAGPCQNCEQKEGQVRDLQQQLQRARGDIEQVREQLRVAQAAAASGGGGAGAGGGASAQELAAKDQEIAALKAEIARLNAELENDDLKGMISAFASGTQAELEKEVMELKTQNTMLEAQVEALQEELAKK